VIFDKGLTSLIAPNHSTTRRSMAPAIGRLVHRIRAEFLEMPGLRLTSRQAARLWHLDVQTCEAVLEALVFDQFLQCTATGAFVRADRT
jgi:hypothetical protein